MDSDDGMGKKTEVFQPAQAQRALDYAYNNVEQAATYLMEGWSLNQADGEPGAQPNEKKRNDSTDPSHKAFTKPQADTLEAQKCARHANPSPCCACCAQFFLEEGSEPLIPSPQVVVYLIWEVVSCNTSIFSDANYEIIRM